MTLIQFPVGRRTPTPRLQPLLDLLACRVCGRSAVTVCFPHIDHRRRKPWPQPYGLCGEHREEVGS